MKKAYFIFVTVILCFVISACSNSGNKNDIAEALPPESRSSISESEIIRNSATEQSVVQNVAASSLPGSEEYIKQVIRNTIPKFTKPDMSEYEKVKAAFDYLIEIGYYTRPIALDIWRFRSTGDVIPSYVETRSLNMLLFGFGTCEDYAASLMMLLEEMGIETRYMTGLTYTSNGGMTYHSWTQAKVDGVWYHLDNELEDGISNDGTVRYKYFLKSDLTMSASHFWGQKLIDYANGRLKTAQIEEISKEYLGENCPQDYPTPTPKQIAVNPRPDTDTLRVELLEELREYEEAYGKLSYIEQNIFPPVFVRYWHESGEEPLDNYGNLVRNGDFVRDYPKIRLLIPPLEGAERP